MKTPAKRFQAAGGEVDATRAVVSHPRRQISPEQRALERAANRASHLAKKAPRGQKMRRLVLAFIARTEALKAGPVAR